MYKKLILTFTLAAGLSVLPNAFAATPPAPPSKPNTTKTPVHSEDSATVVANYDFKIPPRRPPSPPRR